MNKEDIINFFNKRITIVILPTEQCNFRCIYCYEKFENNKMNRKVIDALKNFLEKRMIDLDSLRVIWFGGEPLLAYDTVLEIMEYINSKTIEGVPKIEGFMVTNGYLLNLDKAKKLTELHVNEFQITLDGDEDIHNRRRINIGKRCTFNVIWNNIKSILNSNIPLKIYLRIHLSSDNIESVKSLLNRIKREIELPSNLIISFARLGKYGSDYDKYLNTMNNNSILKELVNYANSLGLKIGYPDLKTSLCYASLPTSFVIRSNGKLSKCTLLLRDEINTVGELKEDGSLNLYQDKIRWWSRGFFSGNSNELICPAQPSEFFYNLKVFGDLKE
ncbi:radical SAM protein [Sulfuracidifex metallicus]|uniref:Radical SAM protein n=2 Tax=Sulfuracidifex metallicus TaxID=47303 RepID=A0A6A9QV20_SULME|nr:radical SAM protein [Sulfuracidifex metallicus]MUN28932.1 radical SAM protein [Sulfuracidifex metallicus DSM 6482 = JCM 9184]WOE50560.1 radical SAM protein [Sulfuracidifex metallicus DSM 6482 = JCM 9184]